MSKGIIEWRKIREELQKLFNQNLDKFDNEKEFE